MYQSSPSRWPSWIKGCMARVGAGPIFGLARGGVLLEMTSPCKAAIRALSPSHQTITDAKGKLGEMFPGARQMIRRFYCSGPNELSVVLHVETPGFTALLGGDLATGHDNRRGWRAVVSSNVRPPSRGHAYKVAHHGSPTGDHTGIWDVLLEQKPIAVLTPYAAGREPRPSDLDVARIKARCADRGAYCTLYPPVRRPTKRAKSVDRTMKEVVRYRMALRNETGHIRLRGPLEGCESGPSVELFGGAVVL